MASFHDVSATQQVNVASAWGSHEFVKPSRGIMEAGDMDKWKKSTTREEIFSFIKHCTESVVGKRCSDIQALEDGTIASTAVMKVVEFMRLMRAKIDDFPPLQQPMRFGNKAFRQWHECIVSESEIFRICNLLSRSWLLIFTQPSEMKFALTTGLATRQAS